MVIDNESTDGSREWLAVQPDIEAHLQTSNLGHGIGLDIGLSLIHSGFVLVLDSDAHLQRADWDVDFIKLYRSDPRCRLMPCPRGSHCLSCRPWKLASAAPNE